MCSNMYIHRDKFNYDAGLRGAIVAARLATEGHTLLQQLQGHGSAEELYRKSDLSCNAQN